MPISQNKYVSITSSQGGQAAAARKDLILRLFTQNELFPTENVLEFENAEAVADFAGENSKEAKIASDYFGWISKQNGKARKISYMRFAPNSTKPYIRSTRKLPSLAELKEVTKGSMVISMGGISFDIKDLSFADSTSYADVAQVVQTSINANSAGGVLWTGAKVIFKSELNSFVLEGGENGENVITYALPGNEGQDISDLLGWSLGQGAVVSKGTADSSVLKTLNKSVDISNNFATFAFVDNLDKNVLDTIGDFCDNQNNEYFYVFDVDSANYEEMISIAGKHSGMCANYLDAVSDIPAYLMPATILAATNYDKVNGTVNYMYQQFKKQAVAVDNDLLANKLDSLKINYNGQTQKSGTKLEFYQDGYMADGVDVGVYANEIWLKDAMKTSILNLLIALDKLPANTDGVSLLEGVLQNVANEAKNNGTISSEKELTAEQKAYISKYTGDADAWQAVYLNGYILSVDLMQEISGNKTKYIAEYALLYSKGDSIRKVEGTHTLI